MSTRQQDDVSCQHSLPDLSVLVDLYFHLPASAPLRKAIAGYVGFLAATEYFHFQLFSGDINVSVMMT